jgi:hypothetical protein
VPVVAAAPVPAGRRGGQAARALEGTAIVTKNPAGGKDTVMEKVGAVGNLARLASGVLVTVASLLPFAKRSGMWQTAFKLQQTSMQAAHVKHLDDQVGQLTGQVQKQVTPAAESSHAFAQQMAAASAPVAVPVPVAPQTDNGQSQQGYGNGYGYGGGVKPVVRPIPDSWTETPPIDPGDLLVLELLVEPARPGCTLHHTFQLQSKPVEEEGAMPLAGEFKVDIAGASWFSRFVVPILIFAGAIAVAVFLLAYLLADLGVMQIGLFG